MDIKRVIDRIHTQLRTNVRPRRADVRLLIQYVTLQEQMLGQLQAEVAQLRAAGASAQAERSAAIEHEGS